MHAHDLLRLYPQIERWNVDMATICAQECLDCAQSCTSCADACLSEKDIQKLSRCIHANLACANICDETGHVLSVLSRLAIPSGEILKQQLLRCRTACEICEQECRKHEKQHEHCRVCADACRSCMDTCDEINSYF